MISPDEQFLRASAAADYLRSLALASQQPLARVGIILGSGLGDFGSHVESRTVIPYASIPHFPQSTVDGHSGNLILGTLSGVPVAVLQGRVHAYEGYTMPEVTFPTRVLGLLGCTTLIVTNAAGGINPDLHPGSLVAIADHINFTGLNAAAGPNEPRFGRSPGPTGALLPAQRFFDMSGAYSPTLRALAIAEAETLGFPLPEGVYLAVLGPSFETPAEILAFRTLGADLVGMSTVHEVIVARHMGLDVLGLSLVTNAAAGVSPAGSEPAAIDHQDVIAIGQQVQARFTALLTAILARLAVSPP